MNETQSENAKATPRRGSRRVRLAIAAVALVGLGTAIGVVATEVPARAAWHGFKEWRHHGHGGSEATVRARAKWMSARALDEVDASDAQREQIDSVIDDLVTKAWPLREQHREHRRALIAELGRPEVSREALEALRTQELALVENISGDLVEAIVAVSGILDAEQRLALVERLDRHRHR